MARFQFRVVGNYFGSPITSKPNFGNGYSVTGPVYVDIDPSQAAPSIQDIMHNVSQQASQGQIPHCNSFMFSTQHPQGAGSNVNLYALTASYSTDPVSRATGGPFVYHLQENLMGASFDLVLQYYLYEVPNPGDPTAPLTQINRAGDRVPFTSPISDIPGFHYDPNGEYFIVWRCLQIATGPSNSNRLNVRMEKVKKMYV